MHYRTAGCLLLLFVLGTSALVAAPGVVGTASLDGKSVGIRFAQAMDSVTTAEPGRYSIAGATVQDAVMPDSSNVVLTVTGLSGTTYTVNGTGIQDALGTAGNFTATGSILSNSIADIGTLASPAYAYAYTTSSIAMKGVDGLIWDIADTAKYVYQTRAGDFDVRVKVNKAQGNANGNYVLMTRESLDPGSRHVAITVYPVMGNWTSFFRDTNNGPTAVLAGNWRINWPAGAAYPNIWLRIKSKANTYTTYGSTNGLNWIQIGDPYTPATPYSAEYIGISAVGTATTGAFDAEFSNFGEYSLGNASIVINQQPQPVTTTENHSATFSVGAQITNGPTASLEYQWLSNGVPIALANSSSYAIQLPKLSDSGVGYSVVVGAPGLSSVTSSVATLTVQADKIAPYALSAGGLRGRTVAVKFNEAMDPVTAGNASLYSLGASMPVESATLLADQQTVVLGVSTLTGNTFSLQLSGVKDLAGNSAASPVNGAINFAAEDIGALASPSLVYADAPSHVISSVSGGVIWDNADSANFVYQTRTNDFDVRVRIDKFQGSYNGNVMLDVRESTDPSSRHVAITVYPTMRNWTSLVRDVYGGGTSVLQGNWRIGWPATAGYPNIWMRLKRAGNTFSTFGSTNGVDWIQIGNDYVASIPFQADTLVGICAATTDGGVTQTYEFSNFGEFSISGASIQITQHPMNVSVEENHPAAFSVGATVVNGPQSALSYQWQVNGADISGATKSTYTIQAPTLANQGDQIRVRLSAPGVEPVFSTAATLTVTRDTTAPAIVTTAGIKNTSVGVQFNELIDPTTAGDASRYSVGGAAVAYATLLADGRSVVLGVPVLSGPSFTLQVTGVKDLAGNALTGSANGVVQDYQVLDIGTLNAPSAVYAFTPESVNSIVDGGAIWFNNDAGNFIGRDMTGDFDVRVQVRKVTGGGYNSNMLLDVRESTEPGSRHVAITVYPSQRLWVSFFRGEAGGQTAVFPGNWSMAFPAGVDYPNIWLRIRKSGSTFTTYGSVNGFDWAQVGDAYTVSTPYSGTFVAMASAVTDVGVSPLETEFANFGQNVVRPALQISTSAGKVVITWPVASTGFRLQKSSQVGAAASWSDASDPVTVVGQNNVVTVTPTGTSFYRLAQ